MKNIINYFLVIGTAAASGTLLANQPAKVNDKSFNPAISLILDGRYTDIDSSELSLPGFQLGGEAGLPDNGFSTGHSELKMSADVDDKFYGTLTAAIVEEGGETELELEEAYIQTLGLGQGVTIKAGKFFSGIGYLNSIHLHAHDFADRALVYDALYGGSLVDTGVQFSWIVPTDIYINLAAEVLSGGEYPGGENEDNNKGHSFFVKIGDDISASSSWQLGASYYATEFDVREAGGHHHGEEEAGADNELLDGEVEITGLDFVYKWAPQGNSKNTNFKFQMEYFERDEDGVSEFTEGANTAGADYDGQQKGYYVQAVYQFRPMWRIGARYDKLNADNSIRNFVNGGIDRDEFLEESGIGSEGDDPERYSFMVDYSPSHFSRLRLQYSSLDDGHESNDMVTLQYIVSLGSHGAHSF